MQYMLYVNAAFSRPLKVHSKPQCLKIFCLVFQGVPSAMKACLNSCDFLRNVLVTAWKLHCRIASKCTVILTDEFSPPAGVMLPFGSECFCAIYCHTTETAVYNSSHYSPVNKSESAFKSVSFTNPPYTNTQVQGKTELTKLVRFHTQMACGSLCNLVHSCIVLCKQYCLKPSGVWLGRVWLRISSLRVPLCAKISSRGHGSAFTLRASQQVAAAGTKWRVRYSGCACVIANRLHERRIRTICNSTPLKTSLFSTYFAILCWQKDKF